VVSAGGADEAARQRVVEDRPPATSWWAVRTIAAPNAVTLGSPVCIAARSVDFASW
jgi:hypothetical protein